MNLKDLKSEIPAAYQKGWVEFYMLRFKVTPDVLIPRPETELLVDETLEFIKTHNQPVTILDLGTGSGAIAISLAKNLSHIGCVTIIASDISEKALKVAQQNAKLHGVQDKITFVQSDLLSDLTNSHKSRCHLRGGKLQKINLQDIDIIVTNLPYIPTQRIPYLDSSVKDFEPHLALDGGHDGFELYRKLFQQITQCHCERSPRNDKKWQPKLILGEIDDTHGELAQNEAQKYFPDSKVEVKKDLAHKQRILRIGFNTNSYYS